MDGCTYKYKIEEISLTNGEPIVPGKINVFVGANNCGKTQLLKDVLAYITGKDEEFVLLKEMKTSRPNNWEELRDAYNMQFRENTSGAQLRHIVPTLDKKPVDITVHGSDNTMNSWLNDNECQFRKVTGAGLVTFLNTDERLNLASSKQVQNLRTQGAKNVLEALYISGVESTYTVRKNIQNIFATDVHLDTSNLGMLQYKVGKDLSSISENTQTAYKQLENYPLLDDQGDGLRSALGIISALVSIKKPIILLDEPEAFLHPPQAMQLGAIISNLIDESQQIFIATHSADFLRGLISTTRDAVIIHLHRSSSDITASKVLDSTALQQIIKDPLLSSSRVLEGMFYKGVVATEADADTVFYQRLYQKKFASDEIHFVNAHNKQTLKKIIAPYQKLGIKFALIADADVIRDKHDMSEILSITQNEDVKNEILSKRDMLYSYFDSQSRYEILSKLKEETLKLANQELPDPSASEEEIASALFDFRMVLGNLREESDILASFKNSGRASLPEDQQLVFDELCKDCSSIGFFIVPVGELESWLVDCGINKTKNKSKWISKALDALFTLEYDSKKEIWRFIDKLKNFLTS